MKDQHAPKTNHSAPQSDHTVITRRQRRKPEKKRLTDRLIRTIKPGGAPVVSKNSIGSFR